MKKTMAIIDGIVKNGVIIPQDNIKLPEGTHVNIIILSIPPELQAELDAWDLASDEDFAEFEKMLVSEKGE
ncbi:MAG: antitoxin AF2212-like protein [Candidatus Poribacteria bacterium]